MNKRVHISFILFLMLLAAVSACTEELDFLIPDPDDRIVVDGWIEPGRTARVLLTANAPYFAVIDSSSFRDLVLTRAKVSLSDGEQTEVLILRKDTNYFPPFYYAGNEVVGEIGKTYTLTAEFGGKTAMASTTIPDPVPIDSTWFQLEDEPDSLGTVFLSFTDPPGEKNHYRIFTRRIGTDNRFVPTTILALDDIHFTGKRAEFSIFRQTGNAIEDSGENYFTLGDTIIVKLCTMDRASFEFWRSLQDELLNAHNPFASSLTQVRSNVSGDGLGIWSGYGVSTDTLFTHP